MQPVKKSVALRPGIRTPAHAYAVLLLAAVVLTTTAQAAWWEKPTLKYALNIGGATTDAEPHFWSKDESDQYLFCVEGFKPTHRGVLYRIQDLVAAEVSSNITPVATTPPVTSGKGAPRNTWLGCALSNKRSRLLTGNSRTNRYTSLPMDQPWKKDENVFTISNDWPEVTISCPSFNHDSTKIYSCVGRWTPDAWTDKIFAWNVVDLDRNGVGLVSNAVYQTSVALLRNLSVYYIHGRDLVYYGVVDKKGARVCVYDPADRVETVLINNELLEGLSAYQIMNVKAGGIRSGKPHLYVQCENGALFVYDLAPDGKSVVRLIRFFSSAEMHVLLGADWPNMLVFEVTDDETHAFFSHHHMVHTSTNVRLYVVWTPQT